MSVSVPCLCMCWCCCLLATHRQVLQLTVGQRRGLLILEGLLIAKAWLRLRLGVAQLDLQWLAQAARGLQIHWSAKLQWARATQVMMRCSTVQQVRMAERVTVQMCRMCVRRMTVTMRAWTTLEQQRHRLIAADLHNQRTLLGPCSPYDAGTCCQLLGALWWPIAAAKDQWPLAHGRLTAGQAQQQQQSSGDEEEDEWLQSEAK